MSKFAALPMVTCGLLVITTHSTVFAQQGGSEQSSANSPQQIEEVVVTARRRTESLQDVPVSVMAFSAEDMELRGIQQMEDLSARVPNISLIGGSATGDQDSSFVMRGVPGVGTFVDGIWQSSTLSLLRRDIVEVERIEVLRGPQGTLFGKNTTGGAIQVLTKRPADEFGARATMTAGTYNRQDISAAIDLPLTDTLRTKWTAASLNQDGYVTSVTTGRKFGDTDSTLVRGDIVWAPTDTFDARVVYQHTDRAENGGARIVDYIEESGPAIGQTISRSQYFTVAGVDYTNLTGASGFPGGELGGFETRSSMNFEGARSDSKNVSLDVNWQLNEQLNLRMLSGYQELEVRLYSDLDASEITLIEDDRNFKQSQFTQEFQFTGEVGDRFTWLGGAFFWDETEEVRHFRWTMDEFRTGELDFTIVQDAAAAMGGGVTLNPGPSDQFLGDTTDGWAVFGEGSFSVTDRLSVTLGLRHQEEHFETFSKVPSNPVTDFLAFRPGAELPGDIFVGTIVEQLETDFKSTTGRLSLQYDLSDDAMTYITYSEGFSAGGLDSIVTAGELVIFPYDPEEMANVEVGLRSDWLDRRVRFNASVFRSEWTGIQINESVEDPNNPGSFLPIAIITNAGSADVDGAEIEAIFLPSEHWRFDANIGFLDTEYTDVGRSNQISVGDTFAQAPELTYSIGAQWNEDWIHGGQTVTRIDWAWTDDYERIRQPDRQRTQESFGLLNAHVSYIPPSENWQLSIFGTNLTNERYLNSGSFTGSFGIDFATVGRPREAGVTLKFYFD